MARHSAIEWTDHTFNPWWGCTKVSPGCVNCYAETWATRYGHDLWGNSKGRRLFGDRHWRQPEIWNRNAAKSGARYRVFCASMADVFEENSALNNERERLWKLIENTPMLDWLLLTKRPENVAEMIPWERWPQNVWAMVSVENQKEADSRIPLLVDLQAPVRSLSVEPLIGPVDLSPWIDELDWIIVGGESGYNARPMQIEWVRNIRDLCIQTNTPFFFKQWGKWIPSNFEEGEPISIRYSSNHIETHFFKAVGKKAAGRSIDGLTWNEYPFSKIDEDHMEISVAVRR